MKKGDFIWGGLLLIWVVVLAVPGLRTVFMDITGSYPYISGFFKFFILATMGDMLGYRVLNGQWLIPKGVGYKAVVWGIIGMMITLSFIVYSEGVAVAQTIGRLPFNGSVFAHGFLTSIVMNLTFAPFMFLFHKFAELYIDVKCSRSGKVTMTELIGRVDFNSLIGFSMVKTIPLFWIPCHTIVFLMPAEYRVIASAFLSIALGLLLAISKKSKKTTGTVASEGKS